MTQAREQAQLEKTVSDMHKLNEETRKLMTESHKLMSESHKLAAETKKTKWYEFAILLAFAVAIVAATKIFL